VTGKSDSSLLKGYSLVFGLFGLLIVDLAIIVGVLSLILGPRFFEGFITGKLSQSETVLYVSLLYFLVLATITLYWKRVSGDNVASTGLCASGGSLRGFAQGALLGAGAFVFFFGVLVTLRLATTWPPADAERHALNASCAGRFLLDSLAVYAIAITEEYMFRGVVLRLFMRHGSIFHAIVATNVLFAACHMFGHMAPAIKVLYFITLVLLGSALSVAALRTGRLWYPIGFHGTLIFLSMLKDTFGVLKILPGPYAFLYGLGGHAMAGVFSIALFAACLALVSRIKQVEEHADGS
jgi:membrane protease YdiL (CAAX protease family)